MRKNIKILSLLLVFLTLLGCTLPVESVPAAEMTSYSLSSVPEYAGEPYIELNGNVPEFSEDQFTTQSYEFYTDLDQIGRCGICYANIGPDLMPTEERGSISSVHPSGWVQAQYDCVDGKNLYNRCHLIGYQLTGENANDHNLITGTRYLNVEGMLPFENQVAEYIRETGHHVLYRVTPVFQGDDLVASGVIIEAMSVEDGGDGVLFNVYCYNVQPGVTIDYADGSSAAQDSDGQEVTLVLNTNTKKFHLPACSSVTDMKEEYRQEYTGSRDLLTAQGYSPCGRCKP